jgi:hypothetical protein
MEKKEQKNLKRLIKKLEAEKTLTMQKLSIISKEFVISYVLEENDKDRDLCIKILRM